jgi:hypothetical protein
VALSAFPESVDNTVRLEIGSIFGADVVVTSGPGLQIERIPSFRADGQPRDIPGFNNEFPLVFEYAGDQQPSLQQFHDTAATFGSYPATLIIKHLSGLEAFRWTTFNVRLTAIAPGDEGRTRYTLTPQPSTPDAVVNLAPSAPFPALNSINPATDKRTEIAGPYSAGLYPAVEIDTAARTVTLTYDYIEAGSIFQWIHNTATGADLNRAITVSEESAGAITSRTIFHEAFPISFQHFTGFSQAAKAKLRVVVTYGFAETM